MDARFACNDKTKGGNYARLFAYEKIKDRVLGKNYNLSLAFVGLMKSKNLNNAYRNKNKPTNVLSFALGESSGEIIITPKIAKKQAPSFGLSERQFIAKLFIHGLLHLKGFAHGSRMEKEESKLLEKVLAKKF